MIDAIRPLALVTGASRGIGAALARELAQDGHDLVLVSRSVVEMESLAAELSPTGARSVVVQADLAQPGAAARLADEIAERGLTIDVLVANAGLGGLGRFDEMDPQHISTMLQVNIVALTELTRLLLPGMRQRGSGRVMLLASTAGFQPGPRMAVYFATKSYVLSFGEAIAYELRGSGVTVTVLCPGATATDFFKVAGAGENALGPMMSAAAVARIGYRALQSGRRVKIAGAMNRAMIAGARLAPHALTLRITAALMARR